MRELLIPKPEVRFQSAKNMALPVQVAITDRLVPRYYTGEPDPEDTPEFTSVLNTPVFSPLEFLRPEGVTLQSQSDSVGKNSNAVLRIDTIAIEVTQTKNIVKTPISGRSGTIKEFVSLGDYMISFSGSIVSKYPKVFPENDIKVLIELIELSTQLPIANNFLLNWGIKNIVIETSNIAELVGSRNTVPFTFSALSDGDDEIVIRNKNHVW